MPSLEVNLAGVKMKNPIGVVCMATATGRGPREKEPIASAERVAKHFLGYGENGAGYVITPPIAAVEDYPKRMLPSSRTIGYEDQQLKWITYSCAKFYNNMYRLPEGIRLIEILKRDLPVWFSPFGDREGPVKAK